MELLRSAPGASQLRAGQPSDDVATTHVPSAMRKRRQFLALIAILLGIGGSVWWWSTERPAPQKYMTVKLTRGPIARSVNATGTVNPVLTVIVGSYVSGVIRNVYCDYNTRVRKGQLCAKIDPRSYEAALDQAKGQSARDSAQLEMARVDRARYSTLIDQDSIARQTYDGQVALVHQLEGTVQLDRALVRTAEVNLGYTDILSPVDGTVVARNITIGQTVAASFQTPTLFLIATDLTKMQVDTNVSESDIGAVKPGDRTQFSVEAFPQRVFRGTVADVRQAPQTVQNVVTYDVVIAAENPDFALKPGMTAAVSIITEEHAGVLRIPDRALRYNPAHAPAGEGVHQVWVLRKGEAIRIPVTIGLDDDTYSELLRGELSESDELIAGELTSDSTPSGTAVPGYLRSGR